MENFSQKKQYENLNSEQNKILSEINDLLLVSSDVHGSLDKFMARQKAAKDFILELEDKGYNPLDYILWHRVLGSTPQDSVEEFDTPESDIENFVRDFDAKYESKK
jgi:hypothetical protein